MKKLIFPFLALLVMVGFLVVWIKTGKTEQVEVKIELQLEKNGLYWSQFILPEGELMLQADYAKYKEYHAFSALLSRVEINHGRVVFGTFCCDDTTHGKYSFIQTVDWEPGVKNLVLFASDGSIWLIPIPDQLLNPQNGETTTLATIFR